MAVSAERVAVTDASAVALNTASTAGATLRVKPVGSAIDVGDSAVTSGAGYEIADGSSLDIDLDAGDVLFAIAPSLQSATVQVLST